MLYILQKYQILRVCEQLISSSTNYFTVFLLIYFSGYELLGVYTIYFVFYTFYTSIFHSIILIKNNTDINSTTDVLYLSESYGAWLVISIISILIVSLAVLYVQPKIDQIIFVSTAIQMGYIEYSRKFFIQRNLIIHSLVLSCINLMLRVAIFIFPIVTINDYLLLNSLLLLPLTLGVLQFNYLYLIVFRFSYKSLYKYFIFSKQYIYMIFFSFSWNRAPIFILNTLLGELYVGIYFAIRNIINFINLFIEYITNHFSPMLGELSTRDTRKFILKTNTLFIYAMFLWFFFFVLFVLVSYYNLVPLNSTVSDSIHIIWAYNLYSILVPIHIILIRAFGGMNNLNRYFFNATLLYLITVYVSFIFNLFDFTVNSYLMLVSSIYLSVMIISQFLRHRHLVV